MKSIFAVIPMGMLILLVGCRQGTSGGPGAADKASKSNLVGQTEDTFSLSMSSTKLSQGETKTVSVGIKRGKNFSEDVSLSLGDPPVGVTLEPAQALIKHGDTEAKFALTAASDAALGDFTVKVTGHPTKGTDAVADMKISVSKSSAKDVSKATSDDTTTKQNEYAAAMQKQLDQFSAKYEELKVRAGKAEGEAKTNLDIKLAEAKTKLDSATEKLHDSKSTGSDRWEKVKEGVENAFDDLKKVFE